MLAQANADSAERAARDAAAYTLASLPGPRLPPSTDAGFDRQLGRAVGATPRILEASGRKRFEGAHGVARAVVDGALELRSLAYASPLPTNASVLEVATVTAVNAALAKAKSLFQETAGAVVDTVTNPGARTPLPDPRSKALLVVENAPRLRASNEKLQARLTSFGFQV